MKKFKFLVFIDDDYATNRFHEIVLEEAGICDEYKFFSSGVKAMEFFAEEAKKDTPRIPEYIFLDINMPRMNGWQFLDKYTQTEIPQSSTIIMLTTSISTKDRNKAKEYEVVENFMNKPLTADFLARLIE